MPEWDNNRGGNWNQGRDNDRDWGRDGRGGHDNDWDRGRRDNDWNRGGWDNGWGWGGFDWDWDKKHKKRKYNYYPTNPWWYPYWNQWVAPIVNPIFSWFQPYPYGYPGVTTVPQIIYP